MSSDKWLTRAIATTVCLLALAVTVTACVMFLQQMAVPDPLDRLVTLLLGGLLGRLTTSKQDEPVQVQAVEPEDEL